MNPGVVSVSPVRDETAMGIFLRFPWRIYQHDPYWVPPLLPEQRKFLDPKHGPFFEIGEAQYFLAFRNGEPVGRISAHVNRLHDEHYGPETGFFGFFECVNDQEVANALFAAAEAWLRERGRTRLVGPLNFSIYDEIGLLVEGFDSMPAFLQTHNPPYYLDLLTSLGFQKGMDWYAFRIQRSGFTPEQVPKMEKLLATIMQGQNLTFARYRSRDLEKWGSRIHTLFNEAWSRHWGHLPITEAQFSKLLGELKPLLRPYLVNLILDGDRVVAFGISVPDLNPLIQKLNGRLTLWSKLRLYYAARFGPVRKIRSLVMGVHQPYQGRRLHVAMMVRSYLNLVYTPIEEVDLSLLPSTFTHYLRSFEVIGAKRYKTFRVFEKAI
jgi:hypothetical protein